MVPFDRCEWYGGAERMTEGEPKQATTEGAVARIGRLVALYVAQGIPFGFATIFIPLMMAERADFKYRHATFMSLAQFPWLLKFLWAPAADSRYSRRLGRRRSWILPAQFLLAMTALAATTLDFHGSLIPIFCVAAFTSLWAAVQDTSVDGLAVDMLRDRERGLGNSAQVGGYKIGMVIGSSGLAVMATHFGTSTAMGAMSGVIFLILLVPLLYREPPPPAAVEEARRTGTGALVRLWAVLKQGAWIPTLAFIGTVKISESMAGAVSKLYLVHERHVSVDRASFLMGVVGLSASIAGSVLGGVLAGRWKRTRLLLVFGLMQAVGIISFGVGLHLNIEGAAFVGLIVFAHFASGLLTPVLYAYMMDITDPSIAATHYTMLATIELLAKGGAGFIAGPLADVVHVPLLLMIAGTVGALPLFLLPWVRPAHPGEDPAVEKEGAVAFG